MIQQKNTGNIIIYVVIGVLVVFVLLKFVAPSLGLDLFKKNDNSIEYSHADGFPKNINVNEQFNKARLVITDQQKLEEAIKSIDKNNEIKVPEINFDRKIALFVTSTTKQGAGFETRIKKISYDNEDILVEIRDQEPGETCINTQEMNLPVDLVIMDKTDAQIEFQVFKYVKECN